MHASRSSVFVAREHGFTNWPKLAWDVRKMARANSPAATFKAAADAVISGDDLHGISADRVQQRKKGGKHLACNLSCRVVIIHAASLRYPRFRMGRSHARTILFKMCDIFEP